MSFKKISLSLFISIFLVSMYNLTVKNEINKLYTDITLLNEDVKFYQRELEELKIIHHNLYSPQKLFELANDLDFIRIEQRVEKDNLLQPYDMTMLEEIEPQILGYGK